VSMTSRRTKAAILLMLSAVLVLVAAAGIIVMLPDEPCPPVPPGGVGDPGFSCPAPPTGKRLAVGTAGVVAAITLGFSGYFIWTDEHQ
jgi:hypothetical protein